MYFFLLQVTYLLLQTDSQGFSDWLTLEGEIKNTDFFGHILKILCMGKEAQHPDALGIIRMSGARSDGTSLWQKFYV